MNHILSYTWNHENFGIDLGFIMISAYGMMWALAFIIGNFIMKNVVFKTEHVDIKYLEPFLIYTIVGCVLGARIGDCMFYSWDYYQHHILEIFLPFRYAKGKQALFGLIPNYEFTGFRGLASHGATIGMMISTYLYHRKFPKLNLLWIFDRLVLAVPIGGALIRLGNFFNSEILGKQSDLPWAVTFTFQSSEYGPIVPRHPAQLYEAICYVILFFITLYIYKKTDKKNLRGWMFGFFLVCLWTIRFMVEFLKEPQSDVESIAEFFGGYLNNGQLLSIPFIIIGLVLMFTAKPYKQAPILE